MTHASSPKRKSGLPSPASGVLSSNRKSKLQIPARRSRKLVPSSTSGLSNLATTPRKRDSIRSISNISSVATTNATFEAAKRSLNESSSFLPERRKSIIDDATKEQRSPTRRKHSASSSTSSSFTAADEQNISPRRKLNTSSLSSSFITATSSVDDEEAVKVCIRIKPLLEDDNETRAFVLGPENTIIKNTESSCNTVYQYNHVYGETSSTQQLYDDMVCNIVESVGQGRNGTVFTYGQTSTGKTYTAMGVLMAAGKDLFGMTGCNEHGPSASTSLTSIRISCMELYNEELRDLLCPSTATLSIQEDRRGNVIIPNLTERITGNITELMEAIQIAEENRTVGATAMNEQSSRSHTIFRINYVKKEATNAYESFDALAMEAENENKENDNIRSSSQRSSQKVVTTVSTLNLVDLAGSESVRVTGAKGERQKEGGKINQSLLTLSRVLAKLGRKDRGHINYRDSKLTRILKPSLSGNARMGCICCISPAESYKEESKSTLDFASRTMLVTTNAKANTTVEYDDALVEEFEREIERAKMETAKTEESRLQMQQSLQDAEDQIVCLRATIELEKSKVSSLERVESNYLMQVEELKSCNNKHIEKLQREISHLKARNQELETDMAQCEEQRERDRAVFEREKNRLKEEHEEMKEMYREVKAELEANSEELEKVRTSKTEFMNAALALSLDEIAALKSDIAAISKEKMELERKLERETQKAQRRKDEAKQRRQKFKGKLVGMTELLKEDLVQLSYQKEF